MPKTNFICTWSLLQAMLHVLACLSRVQSGRPVRANWPTERVTEEVQTILFNNMGASPLGLEPLNYLRYTNIPTHQNWICHTAWQPCHKETNLFSKNERRTGSLYLWVKGNRYNPGLWWSLPMHCKLSANQTAGLAQWGLFLSVMSGGCYKISNASK